MALEQDAAELAGLIAEAKRPCAMTGAGVSEESGIPTFRGPGGLWRHFKPEDLATPKAFRADPKLVWEWYDWRRGLVAKAKPNAAHAALARIGEARPEFTLVTQNVDGLHGRAGSKKILEVHGNLWKVRCTGCGKEEEDHRVPLPVPPRCGECGGLLRPGVVWFGESLPPGVFGDAWRAAKSCDLFLSIGTSAIVEPAASLIRLAAQHGARVAVINPEPTAVDGADVRFFPYKAGELFAQLKS